MINVIVYFDTRRSNKNNEFPLKLSISYKGKSELIPTGISIKKEQWKNGLVIDHEKSKIYNQIIKNKILSAEFEILQIMQNDDINKYSAKELKQKITGLKPKENKIYSFSQHFDKYIENCKKQRTKEIYQATKNKIKEFSDNDLQFENINFAWLKDFENFCLSQGLKTNSISIHLRNIRAVFNDAINRELADANKYPFRRFKIKNEKTKKRSLTAEQLTKIRDCECADYLEKYRDIFMLIFYLIGINIVDLLHLKSSDVQNGRIEYKRAKTSRNYSIKIEPEAQFIIDKYKGENYLLNILDRYKNYVNFSARMNKHLKEIHAGLTTYYARHTWATIAAGLEIPKETIAQSLGHGGDTVTDIYIDFDQKKIDDANRKVIDYVNNYKKATD